MDIANTSDKDSLVQPSSTLASSSKPSPDEGRPTHWIAGVISAVALPTALISMFGYGVMMGVTLSLNLDHGSMINGPFDLLTLIWPGAIMLMTMMGKGDLWHMFTEAVHNSFWVGVWLGVKTLCSILLFQLIRHKQRGERAIAWAKNNLNREMSVRKAFSVSVAVWVFTALVVPLMHLVGALFIVSGFVVAMTTPVLGYMSGRAYVEDVIFKPRICADTPTHQERMRARESEPKDQPKSDKKKDDHDAAAACVAISSVDPSKVYLKAGRLVVANARDVLLWDPTTGQGGIISREGMSLTSINQKVYESLIPYVTGLYPQASPEGKPLDNQSKQ